MWHDSIGAAACPQASRFAFNHRAALGTDAVSVTYFGDGAGNIAPSGDIHPPTSSAAWKLPVCFFSGTTILVAHPPVSKVLLHRRA